MKTILHSIICFMVATLSFAAASPVDGIYNSGGSFVVIESVSKNAVKFKVFNKSFNDYGDCGIEETSVIDNAVLVYKDISEDMPSSIKIVFNENGLVMVSSGYGSYCGNTNTFPPDGEYKKISDNPNDSLAIQNIGNEILKGRFDVQCKSYYDCTILSLFKSGEINDSNSCVNSSLDLRDYDKQISEVCRSNNQKLCMTFEEFKEKYCKSKVAILEKEKIKEEKSRPEDANSTKANNNKEEGANAIIADIIQAVIDANTPEKLVLEHYANLADGYSWEWKIEPGKYRIEMTSTPNGVQLEFLGSNCEITQDQKQYTKVCEFKSMGRLRVVNPSLFGMGPEESVDLRVFFLND